MLVSWWYDETGAVTVDHVVLTAAIMSLGLATAAAVFMGSANLGQGVVASLTGVSLSVLP